MPAMATSMKVSICPADPLKANSVKLPGPNMKIAEQMDTTMTTRTIDRCGAWYLLSTRDRDVGSTRSNDQAKTFLVTTSSEAGMVRNPPSRNADQMNTATTGLW